MLSHSRLETESLFSSSVYLGSVNLSKTTELPPLDLPIASYVDTLSTKGIELILYVRAQVLHRLVHAHITPEVCSFRFC